MGVKQLHELGEVGERPGQAIDLVDDHNVDPALSDVSEQLLQAGSVQAAAGEAAVVVMISDQSPSFVGLALDVGLRGLPLSMKRVELLTWGVSGQAHHAAVPRTTSASVTHCEVLSLAPAAGASPAKRGEAQRSRERSDLDPPAAGYTVASERALARSWLPLRSLPRSFILTLRILLLRLDPKREPVFRHAALTAASPHIRSSLWGSDHNPSCSRASGSGWRDHPVKRRVSAREFIRGHRPPGSGEAVAFSFAGMGLSH